MRSLVWLCAAAAVLLGGYPARASDDGWAAYDAERFDDAVRLWLPAAKAGDPAAEFGLGIAYDLGQGVTANELVACDWYRRAGAAGHAAAAFNTGIMYDSGRCGPRRADLAALWYARAAGAGHGRAQYDLAQLYAAGDGVPRNPDVATAWFRAAAANGISAAASRIQPPPRFLGSKPMLSVTPLDTSDAPPKVGGATVLAWTAPLQPGHAHFFVEVTALEPAGAREVVAQYVDESAVLVRLPPGDTSYAWRVMTVSSESARYAMVPWQRLEARP